MAESLSLMLLLVGAFFMFVAALGVLRMPDLLMRMHSSTKSATLGAGCALLGAALYFGNVVIGVRAMAAVVFLFATAPIATHLIGRAAYFSGVPLWEGTLSDDLRGRYDEDTHVLSSPTNGSAAEPRGNAPS